jgi:hypothetical protein
MRICLAIIGEGSSFLRHIPQRKPRPGKGRGGDLASFTKTFCGMKVISASAVAYILDVHKGAIIGSHCCFWGLLPMFVLSPLGNHRHPAHITAHCYMIYAHAVFSPLTIIKADKSPDCPCVIGPSAARRVYLFARSPFNHPRYILSSEVAQP